MSKANIFFRQNNRLESNLFVFWQRVRSLKECNPPWRCWVTTDDLKLKIICPKTYVSTLANFQHLFVCDSLGIVSKRFHWIFDNKASHFLFSGLPGSRWNDPDYGLWQRGQHRHGGRSRYFGRRNRRRSPSLDPRSDSSDSERFAEGTTTGHLQTS